MKRVIKVILGVFLATQATKSFAENPHGSAEACHVVKSGAYDVFQVTFLGRRMAQVRVIGFGPTVLKVLVLDDAGEIVAADSDFDGESLLTWVPSQTGTFTVVVVNESGMAQDYYISHN